MSHEVIISASAAPIDPLLDAQHQEVDRWVSWRLSLLNLDELKKPYILTKKKQDNNRKMEFQRRKESYSQLIGRAL